MKIEIKKNKAINKLIQPTLASVMPKSLIRENVRCTKDYLLIKGAKVKIKNKRLFVFGFGKASGRMAEEIEKLLPLRQLSFGHINTIRSKYSLKKINVIAAGHPLPDENSLLGAKIILEAKKKYRISSQDLVLFLVSGGGSAMLESLSGGITLKDLKRMNKVLLGSGASIGEINTIRKHISKVKGGRLAEHFFPAPTASIIISDVMGNDLSTIASGPSSADQTTYLEALKAIEKYRLKGALPERILEVILKGVNGEIPETPKKITNAQNIIIGDNNLAIDNQIKSIKKTGITDIEVRRGVKGEAQAAAQEICNLIKKSKKKRWALVFGGETTVTLGSRPGKGGRNQEFILACLKYLIKLDGHWIMASVASDGADYLSGVGGAIIDHRTIGFARARKLDIERHLKRHNSYGMLQQTGSLIKIKPTGTNVGDFGFFIRH